MKNISDKSKILIINSLFSERDFKVKVKAQHYQLPQYALKSPLGTLNLPLEGEGLPFLFIFDENYLVSKIHAPFKELPKYTDEYLSYINLYIEDKMNIQH